MNDEDTIACTICGKQTPMVDTKVCDPCWELEQRLKATPELAWLILHKILPPLPPLPPRRSATKIEVEAMQSVCNMQDELEEAWIIIRALLGAPPPRTWAKWPNVHKQATEFLKRHKSGLQEKR